MSPESKSTSCSEQTRITSDDNNEQKRVYNILQKHVNGYVKIQGTSKIEMDGKMEEIRKDLFLRCSVKDDVGCGDPTMDGHAVVRVVKSLIWYANVNAESLHEVADAFFQKLLDHHEQSQLFLKRYNTMLETHENRGAQSLSDVRVKYSVTDMYMHLYFESVYYQEQTFAELENAEWMYVIDIRTRSVEVRKRFKNPDYELMWIRSFQGVTKDWMNGIKNNTISYTVKIAHDSEAKKQVARLEE